MKIFRDSNQIAWTVFEVRRRITSRNDTPLLPSGYDDGWLCFECATEKKRLVRYPERWREFSDAELERLLKQASPAPRGSFRPGDDIADPPFSSDLR